MKQIIQLAEEEIKVALIDYLRTQGVNLEGKVTEISFNAGRKGNGNTAEIEVSDKTHKVRAKRTKVITASKDTVKEIEKLNDEEVETETTEETEVEVETEVEETTEVTEAASDVPDATEDDSDGAEDEVTESTAKKSLFN